MKIEIVLEDFWTDDESGLTIGEQLKEYLVRQVVQKLSANIEKKVLEYCQTEVAKQIETNLYQKLNLMINSIITNPDIKLKDNKSIEDVIRERFLNSSGWNSPNDTIDKLAKQLGAELKSRYDILFATQIVAKLHENGMLKEGVEKLLLTDKK